MTGTTTDKIIYRIALCKTLKETKPNLRKIFNYEKQTNTRRVKTKAL